MKSSNHQKMNRTIQICIIFVVPISQRAREPRAELSSLELCQGETAFRDVVSESACAAFRGKVSARPMVAWLAKKVRCQLPFPFVDSAKLGTKKPRRKEIPSRGEFGGVLGGVLPFSAPLERVFGVLAHFWREFWRVLGEFYSDSRLLMVMPILR